MEDMIAQIRKRHFARAPAPQEGLHKAEGLGLPQDLLQFYKAMEGACLHETKESGGLCLADGRWWKWAVLNSAALAPLHQMEGYDFSDSPLLSHQRFWIPIVDVMDGNYLAINTEPGHLGEVIDCFHETLFEPGYQSIVALSFTELLQSLLVDRQCFWLQPTRPNYGAY